ncbi:sugar-binding protein [Cytophagaceae bacterium ABcell3]|nr:sugar-binding protein [Cytophagaceae bacterium ABcell3]
MIKKLLPLAMLLAFGCGSPSEETTSNNESSTEDAEKNTIPAAYYENGDYAALRASKDPVIDGYGNEEDWDLVPWKTMDHVWLGEEPSPEDLSGRYKMLWTDSRLYFLVEITDDSLSNQREDPFDDWWEDDCLELFIDEDHSGGNHQFNHSAFAYHITLDYDVVDLGPDEKPHLYNDHLEVKRTKDGNVYTWEVGMKVFDDTFEDDGDNTPVKLHAGKKMGYAVSYNDNDGNFERENFLGSVYIEGEGEERNKGWIDAGVFGTLRLLEQ